MLVDSPVEITKGNKEKKILWLIGYKNLKSHMT